MYISVVDSVATIYKHIKDKWRARWNGTPCFYDRHTLMCRWFLALAVLSIASDFGKHHFILIQDHLVWLSQGASRVVFLLSLSGNSSLLDVPLLCLILQPDFMIQWLSLFITLWYFTTQSSGIIHYTRTLQVPLKNLHALRVVFFWINFVPASAEQSLLGLCRVQPKFTRSVILDV